MKHIRYNLLLQNDQLLASLEAIKPYVFIDKLVTRIATARPARVKGRGDKPNFKPNYFWVNAPNGIIGAWASGLDRDIYLDFNPSTLANGYNIFPFRGSAHDGLMDEVLPYLAPHLERWHITPLEMYLMRAGLSVMSRIHLTADFEFPSMLQFANCMRDLRSRWACIWNQKRDDSKPSGFYIKHSHWTLFVYDKDEEVYFKHPEWPDAVKRRCRNRLRIEVRLDWQAILKLESRLYRMYPGIPHLHLKLIGNWQPNIFPLVFDYYVSRLQPRAPRLKRSNGLNLLLYGLILQHGGLPVHPRGLQTEPSYYIAPQAKGVTRHRNPKIFHDPHADEHLTC